MTNIANIKDFKGDQYHMLEIPQSNNVDTFTIKVQSPKIMDVMQRGDIPNHLMSIAVQLVSNGAITRDADDPASTAKALRNLMDVYCYSCMVDPRYEDVKEYMTDDQKAMVFNWGIGEVSSTSRFHTGEKNGASNIVKQPLQSKAKPNGSNKK